MKHRACCRPPCAPLFCRLTSSLLFPKARNHRKSITTYFPCLARATGYEPSCCFRSVPLIQPPARPRLLSSLHDGFAARTRASDLAAVCTRPNNKFRLPTIGIGTARIRPTRTSSYDRNRPEPTEVFLRRNHHTKPEPTASPPESTRATSTRSGQEAPGTPL